MLYNSVKGQNAVISVSAASLSASSSQQDSAANWSNKLLGRVLLKRIKLLYKIFPLMVTDKNMEAFLSIEVLPRHAVHLHCVCYFPKPDIIVERITPW